MLGFILGAGLLLIAFEVYLVVDLLKRMTKSEREIENLINDMNKFKNNIIDELEKIDEINHSYFSDLYNDLLEVQEQIRELSSKNIPSDAYKTK